MTVTGVVTMLRDSASTFGVLLTVGVGLVFVDLIIMSLRRAFH